MSFGETAVVILSVAFMSGCHNRWTDRATRRAQIIYCVSFCKQRWISQLANTLGWVCCGIYDAELPPYQWLLYSSVDKDACRLARLGSSSYTPGLRPLCLLLIFCFIDRMQCIQAVDHHDHRLRSCLQCKQTQTPFCYSTDPVSPRTVLPQAGTDMLTTRSSMNDVSRIE